MKKYIERIVDKKTRDYLEIFGAILIAGPKACGKTTTAENHSKSVLKMQDPDERDNNMSLAKIRPSLLLEGENPRLIDEWQMAPELWDAVRHEVDKRNEEGLFILTGSTTIDRSKISHSGIGRIARIDMKPLSLFESGESTGEVSIKGLFEGKTDISCVSRIGIEDISKLAIKGGWPKNIFKSTRVAMKFANEYCKLIAESEINTVDGVKRDRNKAMIIMRSLARNTGTVVTLKTILEDVNAHYPDFSRNTLSEYLDALKNLYILDDVESWSPKLRSKTEIRKSSKRYFVDPSLAASLLNASPEKLLRDINTFGFIFESLVVRDLKIYIDSIDGKVFHYRDRSGLEVDAVLYRDNGQYGLVEIKLGQNEIEKAAVSLKKLRDKIEIEKLGEPSFLMVVTGTKYAYRREDGVFVVPIGCLKN